MSAATLSPAADGFDDFEFGLIVAGYYTQPHGKPLPEPEQNDTPRVFRPTKAALRRADQDAINLELGIRRHRTHERET
jgi:hypothetical protein